MCKAMKEMRNEAEARGEARGMANGIIELVRNMRLTDDRIVDKPVDMCKITRENARELLKPTVA